MTDLRSAAQAVADFDRFWQRVDKSGECWMWTGSRNTKGYGRFDSDGRHLMAHRVAYEMLVGPIPDGMQLDHLCRVPACVNPAHLEPVTSRENTMRGIGPSAQSAVKTHCSKGHPLSGDNLMERMGRGRLFRDCRTCRIAENRAYRQAHGPEVAQRKRERRAARSAA